MNADEQQPPSDPPTATTEGTTTSESAVHDRTVTNGPVLNGYGREGEENAAALSPREVPNAKGPVRLRTLLGAIVLVSGCAELAYTVVNISAMPVYIRAIPLDRVWVGVAAIAFISVEGVLKSPFGVLGDRIGRKPLILAGPTVSIVTALLTPHIHHPLMLVLLRILDGIGAAALWPSAFSLIGDHVPEARRASAMSLFNLAYLLGLALGPLLGGGVNDWVFHHVYHSVRAYHLASKEASFYVAAVLFSITTIVAILFVPNLPPLQHAQKQAGVEGGFNFSDFKRMLARIPLILLMTFVTFLGIGLVMAYAKLFAMKQFHLSESEFGSLLIGPALVIAAVSVPLGTIGDRIGKARAVKLGIGLCMTMFWLMVLFASKWALLVFGSLLGIGFVIAFPAWMALVSSNCEPGQRGAVIGAVGTAQGIGAITGVAISSLLSKVSAFTVGPIHIPEGGLSFIGCGIMLTISFLLAITSVRDPHEVQPG